MREIIPHKLIVSYDDKGEIKDAILQYRIKEDGVIKNQFYTMAVKDGMSTGINNILSAAKSHAERGERII
jgi:hypothetical protein